MRGYISGGDLPSPRDTSKFPSHQVTEVVAAGATAVIEFINRFAGLARSVLIMNRDAANVATVIINNDRTNSFAIPAGLAIPINDMWLEQIEVTAGAAGAVNLLIEIVPANRIGISEV